MSSENEVALGRLAIELSIAAQATPAQQNRQWAKDTLGAVHDFIRAVGGLDQSKPIVAIIAALEDADRGITSPILEVDRAKGAQQDAATIWYAKAACAYFVDILVERARLKGEPSRLENSLRLAVEIINRSDAWAKRGLGNLTSAKLESWRSAVIKKAREKDHPVRSVYRAETPHETLQKWGDAPSEEIFHALMSSIV